ncbi:MAG: thioredoxin [Planctomycetaceae bacterium]
MQTRDASFENDVLKSPRPVLVDFWASWCPPCKMMQPMVERLKQEYADRADVFCLNIDQNPGTAAQYGISGVPTFITFKDGLPVAQATGAQTQNQLRALISAGEESSTAA